MNGSLVNTLCENSTSVARDAEDLMTAGGTYPRATLRDLLKGKKGLVTGIANSNSIAYGAARAFHEAGAEIILTYGRQDRSRPGPLPASIGSRSYWIKRSGERR
jgi:hypothetical protein